MRVMAIGTGVLALGAAALAQDQEEQRFFPDEPGWAERFAVDVQGTPLGSLEAVPPTPRPEGAHRYQVTFKGEVAGFDMGRVFLDVAVAPNAYDLTYRMEQRGVARFFSDGSARARAAGTFEGRAIDGSYYYNHDFESEDDQQRVELYRPQGERRFRLWTEPEYWFYEPVTEDMALGATDPMGALVALAFVPGTPGKNPCDRYAAVYDGRKRFDLRLRPEGAVQLKRGGKGRYEGEAYACTMSYTKIAGYRPKDRDDVEGEVTVYLAPVPARHRTATLAYVPVRVTARQGLFGASLEAKYPKITAPDGTVTELY